MKKITFSPVTRLSGLLSVDVFLEHNNVVDANACSTMFRGFEWAMRDRHVTDAVYMTQRVCGICSLAHGAVSSYLLDELYDNEISEQAQLLRNVMYAADFLQNHIRHFYFFSLPDFVQMPDAPPFKGQNLQDGRLNETQTAVMRSHYGEAAIAAQQAHQILALFGGKAPHQHSFLYGGVAVVPTADKVNQALSLLRDIQNFVARSLLPDTERIAKIYDDYFYMGKTSKKFLSFGLFRFGGRNETPLWKSGVLNDGSMTTPDLNLIGEDVTYAWYDKGGGESSEEELHPNPRKQGAYTWTKSVQYAGQHFQVGPLARMIITGQYHGGTSAMDRIVARSLETLLLTELMMTWLQTLNPSAVFLHQKKELRKTSATFASDAMRGALLHSVRVQDEQVAEYNIITPTVWNFSAKDAAGRRGPVESAMTGVHIPDEKLLFTILGRIIRSFDPCISCATHVLNGDGRIRAYQVL